MFAKIRRRTNFCLTKILGYNYLFSYASIDVFYTNFQKEFLFGIQIRYYNFNLIDLSIHLVVNNYSTWKKLHNKLTELYPFQVFKEHQKYSWLISLWPHILGVVKVGTIRQLFVEEKLLEKDFHRELAPLLNDFAIWSYAHVLDHWICKTNICSKIKKIVFVSRWRNDLECLQQWPCYLQGNGFFTPVKRFFHSTIRPQR